MGGGWITSTIKPLLIAHKSTFSSITLMMLDFHKHDFTTNNVESSKTLDMFMI